MKKYRIKEAFIQAKQYKCNEGMEDGFNSYAIGGAFCGYYPKDSEAFPKNILKPVVNTINGQVEIEEGYWIVISPYNTVSVWKDKEFWENYEEIVE